MTNADLLDQLSTSQTTSEGWVDESEIGNENWRFIQSEIAAATTYKSLRCENGAPFIFFVDANGIARLVQGCCNSWTCERCGHMRALHEYGRLVNGARELARMDESLFFMTLTCRGRELSPMEADAGYGEWTNRLLTTCRAKQVRSGRLWAYAAVTERQHRGHPHSHFITTFCSDDVQEFQKGADLPNGTVAKHDTLYSEWLVTACTRAGLGRMVDVSLINNPVAVAVYAAKYMFKEAVETVWPNGWRRVRYSNSWPKLPEVKSPLAFPLVHFSDWLRMQSLGYTVHAENEIAMDAAAARSIQNVVLTERLLS